MAQPYTLGSANPCSVLAMPNRDDGLTREAEALLGEASERPFWTNTSYETDDEATVEEWNWKKGVIRR